MSKENQNGLSLPKTTQVRVVKELVEASRLDFDFYLMLVLSAVVVSLGLLVDNVAVIIGGMLITPLLTPILNLSLGIIIYDILLLKRSLKVILQSLFIVIGVAFVTSFFFYNQETGGQISTRLISNVPYFLVAFSAGLAATFAWARKDMSAMLPGVAIAVSILPPLALVGIGISRVSVEIIRGSLVSFLLNLMGVVLGSAIIFALLNFHKSKKETIKKVKEEIKKEEDKRHEKLAEEIKEQLKEVRQEEKIKKQVMRKMNK
jgi:uncharacterized hydrophobic protein (TIGR00271 family)